MTCLPQVLEDADIARAAKAITSSALLHSGQICMSTERVIVQQKVAPTLASALVAEFSKLRSGGPEANISVLFTDGSAESVISLLREAKEQGAEFLLGDATRDGAVVQPHIVSKVKPGMKLWDRESFGPGENGAPDTAKIPPSNSRAFCSHHTCGGRYDR